jgi:hypothetical protein
MSASIVFRVVCSWCSSVLVKGTDGAPTSHDICAVCARTVFGLAIPSAIAPTLS